jgi:hypothetical protein
MRVEYSETGARRLKIALAGNVWAWQMSTCGNRDHFALNRCVGGSYGGICEHRPVRRDKGAHVSAKGQDEFITLENCQA